VTADGAGDLRVLVLADDLIWSTRLAAFVRAADAEPVSCRTRDSFAAALGDAGRAIVDLTARSYDPLAAVRLAAEAGAAVICVGQHDDREARRAALAAGASRVFAYRRLAEDGPGTLRRWLAAGAGAETGGPPAAAPSVAEPGIPARRFQERLDRVRSVVAESGLAALLVGVGPDLRYLAGYDATALERLTMLVVPAAGPLTLIAPRLELAPAGACPAAAIGALDVIGWEETDDPHTLVGALVRRPAGARAVRVAVSDRLWASHLLRLQDALPDARWIPGSTVVGPLRAEKDSVEIALLRRAAHAADRVVDAIAAGRLLGRTEADVGAEVRARLLAERHSVAEFAIVASGPNSASPHHAAGERAIAAGEPIVLDIGGLAGGYASDTTRTIWVTGGDPARGPDDEFLRLFAVLRAAQAEATHAVRPGVPAERVDAVAREIIAAGGHGRHFIHRVGHGIGLETHEDPYLVAGNAEPLRRGMAFSVEPGIYLEGRYGARIEDIVVCGPDGPDVLNVSSRELRVVDGL
jgi:Xaa-Pro aminopeptidase